MNNTTKAKYELAQKMLKGKIEVSEVAIMTGLPEDELFKLEREINPQNSDAQILKNLDTMDLNIGEILFDNYSTEELYDQ